MAATGMYVCRLGIYVNRSLFVICYLLLVTCCLLLLCAGKCWQVLVEREHSYLCFLPLGFMHTHCLLWQLSLMLGNAQAIKFTVKFTPFGPTQHNGALNSLFPPSASSQMCSLLGQRLTNEKANLVISSPLLAFCFEGAHKPGMHGCARSVWVVPIAFISSASQCMSLTKCWNVNNRHATLVLVYSLWRWKQRILLHLQRCRRFTHFTHLIRHGIYHYMISILIHFDPIVPIVLNTYTNTK